MNPISHYLNRLYQALIPSGTVAERAVKSGIWATLINIVDRVLQLGKLVVLANLLAPADFGLMGIALLTLAVFQQFSNLGLDAALIQNEDADVDRYLDTAWAMKLGRSILIAVLAFIVAPYAASFFGEARATNIIRVIAFSPLLMSLKNPGVMYLQKDLEFHKQFLFTISSTVVSVIVAIGSAIQYQTVWALVVGLLAGNITSVLVSYLVNEYRPSLSFEIELAKELYGYGKWLTLSGILVFLIVQGDDAFVGWFLGATALGFYQMAYRLSNAPATEIAHVISSVAFPTYSKVQNNVETLRTAYFRTIRVTTLVSFPTAVGIIVVSPMFVNVILGSDWRPIIPVMQALAVFAAFRSIAASNGSLFNAIGRPDIASKMQIFNVLKLSFFIYPFTYTWGLEGVAYLLVFHAVTSNPILDYIAIQLVNGSVWRYIKILWIPLIGSVTMGSILSIILSIELTTPSVISLIIIIGAGAMLYIGIVSVLDHYTGMNIKLEIKQIRDTV